MPVTKGAGNPDWSRDETLLALDLLYKHGNPILKDHPEVRDLSQVLQAAKIHPISVRRPSFRNPDGVALKLQNLLSAIEPTRGLSSSSLDRALVAEFPAVRAADVSALASLIREAIGRGEGVDLADDDDIFLEGQFLTSRHRSRDRRLRKKLLQRTSDDKLVCEICKFVGPPLTRDLRESFFEAHHVRPLSESKNVVSTRVTDMALLCASCHRFIHKLMVTEKHWIAIAAARTTLRRSQT